MGFQRLVPIFLELELTRESKPEAGGYFSTLFRRGEG
jgi:hypothetical protein